MNKNKLLVLVFILAFALTSFVYAIGVSAPYWKDNPLKLAPGESKDIAFQLQMEGGNAPVQASVAEGGEIAKITDAQNLYSVIPGEMTPVNIRVTAPANAKIGDIFKIKLSFVTASVGGSGAFSFGSGIDQSFDLIITEQAQAEETAETKISWPTYLLIGIIVLVIIIIVIVIARRKQR